MTRKEWKAINSFGRWSGYTMPPKEIPTWNALIKTREERFLLADRNNPTDRLTNGYPIGEFFDGSVCMRKYFGSRLKGFQTGYLKSNK